MADEDTKQFLESAPSGEPFREAQVDRDTRTIRNVRLLGRQSKNGPNGRRYTESALGDAVSLYEGASVYLDHPTRSEMRERDGVRSVRDLAGRISQPRKTRGGVRGDIQVLDLGEGSANNPADFFFSVAEQMPESAGMSHRAEGRMTVDDDGVEVIEGLTNVAAVEVVTDPATTNGLFESIIRKQEESDMDWDEVDVESLREHKPELIEQIQAESEEQDELKRLREKTKRLRKEADELKAEKAEREHAELVEAKIDEADLPDRLVTDVFRESLMDADDEETIDKLVADRKEIAEAVRSRGPRSTERDHDDLLGEKSAPVTDEALLEFANTGWA